MVLEMRIELRQLLEWIVSSDFNNAGIVASKFTIVELWFWKEQTLEKHYLHIIVIKTFQSQNAKNFV